MKKLFSPLALPLRVDFIFFIIRLIVGLAFIQIGWGKIQNPFHWMGPDAAIPSFLQFLAAISEFGGGIALILGLLTRLAAIGLACTMVVATCVLHFQMGYPFVDLTGPNNFQLPLVYLLISLLMLIAGPGRFSLDRRLFGLQS